MTIQEFINKQKDTKNKPDIQVLFNYRNHVNSVLPQFRHISELILRRYNMIAYMVSIGVPANQAVAFSILYYKYQKSYGEIFIDQNITFDQISTYARTIINPLSMSYLVTING